MIRHLIITHKNSSEAAICIHKKWAKITGQRFKVPKKVWDFLRHYVTGIQVFVVKYDDQYLGMEELLSFKPYLLEYLDLNFYETDNYYDPVPLP